MQWWCAVQEGVAWNWRWQPYPGVWLFILLLVALYVRVVRPPAKAGGGVRIKNDLLVAGGIFSLWLALDWPIGPLGAGFLAGVHMVQYLLIGASISLFYLLLLSLAEQMDFARAYLIASVVDIAIVAWYAGATIRRMLGWLAGGILASVHGYLDDCLAAC